MYFLSEATLYDFEAFLALKSQKDAVKWSGFTSAPDPVSFLAYYKNNVLANPKTQIMFLRDGELEGNPIVGYIQYDIVSSDDIETRGSVIKKSYQGTGASGIMSELLYDYLRERGYKKLIGWISEKNIPSITNSERRGYIRTDEYDVRNMPLLGGEHKFYKWIKLL